jgi:two-component system cell cycle sensor histidine kinase/response regulator CckA
MEPVMPTSYASGAHGRHPSPTCPPRGLDEPVVIASLATSRDTSAPAPDLVEPASAKPRRERRARADYLTYITADELRPAAFVVGALFVVFTIYNWLQFQPGVRGPVCLYDVGLIALGFGLYVACRRITLSSTAIHIAAAVLSFAVEGNILFTGLLRVNPLFSFYTAVLLIASAGSVLSPAWGAAIAAVEIAAWAVVAAVVLPGSELTLHVFVMVASVAVSLIIHVGRYRARSRILELRAGDAQREFALQRALAEADEGRRELDRKVEERTAALRKELEERQRLEEQLRHAQKLEAVGRLAGGIAHDFNNLLTVVRMSLVTVGEAPGLAGDVRDALRDASDATDRAAGLTHDLLAFARKQTLQRTTVAIADILGGVERMVRRVAEASIRLEVAVRPDVGEVTADRHQIEQVLLNLAINACDAMGNRGTLTITADIVEFAGGDAAHHRVRPGEYVRVEVTDTGTGMDEATRRAVFEPFFTTKEVGRGTGLGLAVAHGIITQHGGQIDVETALGVGSTFTVFLPRARGSSPHKVIATSKPVPSLARETLLVVEDEPAVRRAVQRNLDRLGYRVVTATDGEDALRLADTVGGVDLVLSDVVMPGIDGPELACRLREKWRDLPVLFVTGYSADRLARSGAVGPHDRVLEKPYQIEELTRTIREMLEARVLRVAQSA